MPKYKLLKENRSNAVFLSFFFFLRERELESVVHKPGWGEGWELVRSAHEGRFRRPHCSAGLGVTPCLLSPLPSQSRCACWWTDLPARWQDFPDRP